MRRSVALLGLLTACHIDANYAGTRFRCSDEARACPEGLTCDGTSCVLPAGDGDAPAATAYAAAVLADHPILYLRLDELGGDTAADLSGHGHHGTYRNGVARRANGALAEQDGAAGFDGVDDLVEVPDAQELHLDGDFTIELWVRLEDVSATYPGLLRKGRAEDSTGFIIFYSPSNLRPVFKRDSNQWAMNGHPLEAGAFHHYAVVYLHDTGDLRLYGDGDLDLEVTATWPASALTDELFLGRGDDFGSDDIDEVAIYDAALSRDDLVAHIAAAR